MQVIDTDRTEKIRDLIRIYQNHLDAGNTSHGSGETAAMLEALYDDLTATMEGN